VSDIMSINVDIDATRTDRNHELVHRVVENQMTWEGGGREGGRKRKRRNGMRVM
jgi:hypothetical protein